MHRSLNRLRREPGTTTGKRYEGDDFDAMLIPLAQPGFLALFHRAGRSAGV